METFRMITYVIHIAGTIYVSDPYPTREACEKDRRPFVVKIQQTQPGMEFVSRCGPSTDVQTLCERGQRIVVWRPDT